MWVSTDQQKLVQRVEDHHAIINTERCEQFQVHMILQLFDDFYPSARILDGSSIIVGDYYEWVGSNVLIAGKSCLIKWATSSMLAPVASQMAVSMLMELVHCTSVTFARQVQTSAGRQACTHTRGGFTCGYQCWYLSMSNYWQVWMSANRCRWA